MKATRPKPHLSVSLNNPDVQDAGIYAGDKYAQPFVSVNLSGATLFFDSVELAREFLADIAAKIDDAPTYVVN